MNSHAARMPLASDPDGEGNYGVTLERLCPANEACDAELLRSPTEILPTELFTKARRTIPTLAYCGFLI